MAAHEVEDVIARIDPERIHPAQVLASRWLKQHAPWLCRWLAENEKRPSRNPDHGLPFSKMWWPVSALPG
jgi:hypothetical protein